jgi:sterol desaturase/sphingolipid hydroxylase (fatty acid hydroxylase superfamily)
VNWEVVAPAVIVGAVGALVVLERVAPYDPGQRFLRDGFWTDFVGYTFFQSYVLALVIGRVISALDGVTGLSRLRLLASWPVAAQVLFFVVTHDLYIYWFHRWQHSSPVLWRLHEAHHSVESVDWVAASRSHALEILINQTIEFAPMVLLGADPSVPLIKGMIGAVWGMWIHANVGARTGRLQWIVNGPEAHRWHHAVDADARGRNFATKLALWDRLFGTAWLPAERKPKGYGLSGVDFPRGYLGQQIFAFRPFRREAVRTSDGSAVTPA